MRLAMRRFSFPLVILSGFVLVFLGFLIPLLIVLKIVASTFFLNLFAYTASVAGMFLGFIGAATYVREHRK